MDKENPVLYSLELIESRISERLTVEDIASGVYFSKYHYQRLFREIVGDSVMEYVTKRKLTLAGRALLETSATILDIAMDFGYDSRDGFARSFKAYMGVTPTEYRKYGLAAIKQKTVKERLNMSYSKTTDEILRELNDFVAKARETARTARKCEITWYKEFWSSIADKTDSLTDNIQRTLERISDIADNPDHITNRFNILKIIDDTGFHMNVMTLHMDVTIARAKPEYYQVLQPICERYHELVAAFPQRLYKIVRFFNELSALIFEDMRKTFATKMEEVVRRSRTAADMIKGYSYIKNELAYMADELADIPLGEITEKKLNDILFKLPILQFSIDTDIMRSGGRDKAMFEGVEPFKQSLEESIDFINSLPTPRAEEPTVMRIAKAIDDIGYQGSILLFYTRGEGEKLELGALLDEGQKAALDKICEKIDHYIHFTNDSTDEAAFQPIAARICEIKKDMAALADGLGERGGAMRVLSDTFGQLYDKVLECIKSVESD